MFHIVLGIVLGYLAGMVTPSLARKLHAIISKEATKGVSLVDGEIRAAEADIKKKL